MGIFLESFATEALLALAGVLVAFYYHFTSTFNYWKEHGVPFVPPTPLFGNVMGTLLMQKSTGESFQALYNSKELEGARYAGAWLTKSPILLAHDPDFIKDVLIKDFQYFSDRGVAFNEEKEPLQAHLFSLGGWRWRVLRTKLTPTFSSGKMKMMYETMLECAQGLEKLLTGVAKTGKPIEIKEPLAKFTTDVIGTCAFGLQFNSMTDDESEFRKMGRALFEPSYLGVLKRSLISAFPILAKYLTLTAITPEMTNFFLRVVEDTVNYRKENNVSRNDMMQLLIEIQKQGPIVDEEEKYETSTNVHKDAQGRQIMELNNSLLAAQAFVFFLAGFETSSTTMSFALYELARNPEVQEKLFQDIERTLAQHEGKLTYECIQDMKYLDMVISETLRRFPPVQSLFRKVTRNYKIPDSGVVVPKGMRVFIPIYAIQNDPKHYPEPNKFLPERFSPEKKANRHPMVYLPFGEGPRNCIGARFGLLQSKLGLAMVVRNFKVEVCELTPSQPKLDPTSVITSFKGGIHLRLKPRT